MIELILTVACLAGMGLIVWAKENARSSYRVMVPRDIQKGAQHAADVSQKSQVVVYAMGTFEIMRADNQHAARGEIVMVFHPNQERRGVRVGECLKPSNRKAGSIKADDIMVGGVMCNADN